MAWTTAPARESGGEEEAEATVIGLYECKDVAIQSFITNSFIIILWLSLFSFFFFSFLERMCTRII